VSWEAVSAVVDHSEQTDTSAAFVFVLIANAANADGTMAYPKVATLAAQARLSERQVQRILQTLVESGELSIKHGAGPGGRNLYTVHIDRLLAKPNRTRRGVTPMTPRGVTSTTPGGDVHDTPGGEAHVTPGVTPMTPLNPLEENPPRNPPNKPGAAQKPPDIEGDDWADAQFKVFYDQLYPRKEGRPAAAKAFKKHVNRGNWSAVKEGIRVWMQSDRWRRGIIPHPTTWLNQHRWNDTPPSQTSGMGMGLSARDLLAAADALENGG
jgi:hypothetical protein